MGDIAFVRSLASKVAMVGQGVLKALRAVLSACSLPVIPECPGTHRRRSFLGWEINKSLILFTMVVLVLLIFFIAWRTDRLSVQIINLPG